MIVLMQDQDCLEAAKIHKESLEGDFLPTLGVGVLKNIYRGLLKDKGSFGHIAKEDGKIVGFITGSIDTNQMFKKIIKKRFLHLAYHMSIALIKKPLLIKKSIQTFTYDNKTEVDTKAEVISIAIKKEYRGKNLGKSLTDTLITHFKNKGVNKIKVTVNKSNIGANKFYQKLGFKYIETFDLYNKKMNLYTLQI